MSGVVDENIDAPEFFACRRDRANAVGFTRQVRGDEPRGFVVKRSRIDFRGCDGKLCMRARR